MFLKREKNITVLFVASHQLLAKVVSFVPKSLYLCLQLSHALLQLLDFLVLLLYELLGITELLRQVVDFVECVRERLLYSFARVVQLFESLVDA